MRIVTEVLHGTTSDVFTKLESFIIYNRVTHMHSSTLQSYLKAHLGLHACLLKNPHPNELGGKVLTLSMYFTVFGETDSVYSGA